MVTKIKVVDIVRILLVAGFLFAGIMHFAKPDPFVAIVPDWLPQPLLLVHISGAAEIAGAVGLLLPKLQRTAAWGLILLLVAVFPANINMALNAARFPAIPEPILWLRLPFQLVLILLVWLTLRKPKETAS